MGIFGWDFLKLYMKNTVANILGFRWEYDASNLPELRN